MRDLYNTFKSTAPMDGLSIFKKDFKPWDVEPQKSMRDDK